MSGASPSLRRLCSTDFGGKGPCWTGLCSNSSVHDVERLLLTQEKTLGFLASGGEDFRPGPETRLDCSELCVIKFY